MADEDKLDKVLSKLDSINTRLDSIETEHKKDRADAAEMKACVDSVRKDADERKEKDEKEKADKARADAEAKEKSEKEEKEKADKARADAEAKEREEKEKADAAARSADGDVAKKLAEFERRLPASLSDEDKGRFAEVQMRADSAYQAWNYGQAPHALNGETLNDYRVRLLGKIKGHSKVYKDSNLGLLVNDSAAFSVIEQAIVNDAVEASSAAVTVGGPLRKQVSRNESGHTITKFVGDPAVTWGPFMGGATKFGRINRSNAH